jgi:hypothetical protein
MYNFEFQIKFSDITCVNESLKRKFNMNCAFAYKLITHIFIKVVCFICHTLKSPKPCCLSLAVGIIWKAFNKWDSLEAIL